MNNDVLQVAERIRELRLLNDFTVEDIAGKTGVPADVYLQYESGQTDLSISYLFELSRLYGIDMTTILTGEEPHANVYSVVRGGKGVLVERRHDYRYESLAFSYKNKKMDPFMVRVPLSARPSSLYSHEGQEFVYVLEGVMKVFIDRHELTLQPGDSVYFDSTHPHGLCSPEGEARFLVVIS